MAISVAIPASIVVASGQSAAPLDTLAAPAQLGKEQANIWMPMAAVTLRTEAQRRSFMIKRIRDEVAARRSTLDPGDLDRVLKVMSRIDREDFVEETNRRSAYLPVSLDIGFGQTISDAYIVAVMTAAVRIAPTDAILDVGTGSGYQAAVAARLGRDVRSVEIVPPLAASAGKRLARLRYRNVGVRTGDGFLGWPTRAPFQVIIVAAGATAIPPPLIEQLAPGGRMIIPIGPTTPTEQLVRVTKTPAGAIVQCSLGPAAFVPMTGRADAVRERSAEERPSSLRLCFERPIT